MRKITTTVLFRPETLNKLDEYAKLLGTSKSSMIETAVERYFEQLDINIAQRRLLTASEDDFITHKEVSALLK